MESDLTRAAVFARMDENGERSEVNEYSIWIFEGRLHEVFPVLVKEEREYYGLLV